MGASATDARVASHRPSTPRPQPPLLPAQVWLLQMLEALANVAVGGAGLLLTKGTPGLPQKLFALTGLTQVGSTHNPPTACPSRIPPRTSLIRFDEPATTASTTASRRDFQQIRYVLVSSVF